ncbi:hypothetical protein [Paenibacillus pabuli]|uniref:alpha/beta hydrolase n=1 Tax=Paenibacillus pabuli TaxID=1472 RepID=UPI003CF2CBB3
MALSEKEDQYPVLFYSHGAGAYPQQGTLYCQDLASSGFVWRNDSDHCYPRR